MTSNTNEEKPKSGTNDKNKIKENVSAVIYRKTVRDGIKVQDRIEV